MGATRASTWDSPSIATFKTRVARKAGGNFERRRSRHSASNKGLSSWGGPGKSITMRSRPSNFPLSHCPGAVPLGLGSTIAPSSTSACWALLGDIFHPRAAKRRSMPASTASSRRNPTPKAAAENHDLRPEQSVLRGRNQTLEIVADHTFENYFNPQLVDLLGEKKRV